MLQTFIGLILLLLPFLLVYKFKNKRLGFVWVLSFLIAFHLLVAVVTQALHIFTYPVILLINLLVVLVVIMRMLRNTMRMPRKFRIIRIPFRIIRIIKINWVFISVLVITFITLFSVHYNYSGKITVVTTPKYQEVKNMQYPYPYFSDEWYSIAFIKDSIDSQSLPFKDPLINYGQPFINFEFAFHSFLSELFLLLNLNPLTGYTLLTIFFNLLIVSLVYIFLRASKVSKLPASIASLSILYITNGANLPGIWNLIPLNLGIISMLLSFLFINNANDAKRYANYAKISRHSHYIMAGITLLFYPPLLPFCALAIISYILSAKGLSKKVKVKNILFFLVLLAFAGIVLLLAYFLVMGSLENLSDYIVNPTLIKDAIPRFLIWYIVPIPILILAGLGIGQIFKKKVWFFSILLLGIIYWILYSFVAFKIFIGYERLVFLAAILITITAGFGLNWLIKVLKRSTLFQKKNTLKFIQAGVLIFFLILAFGYTKRGNWQKLKLVQLETKKVMLPAAPANQYLHPDDLRIFKDIKHKVFLSLPWKGTVIGVATDNFPKCAKPGTLRADKKMLLRFMNKECDEKDWMADWYDINYVYSPKFNCPNFEFIDKSSEGLHLYRFKNKIIKK